MVSFFLIPAQRTGDGRCFAVSDGDVISQVTAKGDMMVTVQFELFSVQALDDFFQLFHILVVSILLFGHVHLLIKKPPGLLREAQMVNRRVWFKYVASVF